MDRCVEKSKDFLPLVNPYTVRDYFLYLVYINSQLPEKNEILKRSKLKIPKLIVLTEFHFTKNQSDQRRFLHFDSLQNSG